MNPQKSRILTAGVASAIGVAILVGLGSWQLSRLHWKTELVARVTKRVAAPPAAVPPMSEWRTLDLGQWSYRRVRLEGRFDHAKEALVYLNLSDPHGRFKGPGYFIMTPLALERGGTVIVNRGFVPEAFKEQTTRPDTQGPAEDIVTGPLREPETRNAFTPDDDTRQRLFFARDPKAIADGLAILDAAPFTVDAEQSGPGGLPQAGETRVSFPNRHLEYALTWYGLAGTLAAMFLVFAWRTVRDGM